MSTKKTGPAARKGSKAKTTGNGSTEKLKAAALVEIKQRLDGDPAESGVAGPEGEAAAERNAADRAKPRRGAGRKGKSDAKGEGKKTAKPAKPKRVSALDAAAQVLARSEVPMRAKELIAAMEKSGLWHSPSGRTPHATLYAAMIREIAARGDKSRFKKLERGVFVATTHATGHAKN
ncbi:MAG: winged helix-turn-helix domain-containing protein [Phycisphaerales bacterium]